MPDEVIEEKAENRVTSYVTHTVYDAIIALQKEKKWSQAEVVRELLDEALRARALAAPVSER